MSIWKRTEIMRLFGGLICSIRDQEPGGDYDIYGFRITPNGSKEWISVTPFKDPETEPDKEVQDDCEVVAIEVRTNGDSCGGLQTEDEKVAMVFGQIVAILSKAGFHIIAHYDEIF